MKTENGTQIRYPLLKLLENGLFVCRGGGTQTYQEWLDEADQHDLGICVDGGPYSKTGILIRRNKLANAANESIKFSSLGFIEYEIIICIYTYKYVLVTLQPGMLDTGNVTHITYQTNQKLIIECVDMIVLMVNVLPKFVKNVENAAML